MIYNVVRARNTVDLERLINTLAEAGWRPLTHSVYVWGEGNEEHTVIMEHENPPEGETA